MIQKIKLFQSKDNTISNDGHTVHQERLPERGHDKALRVHYVDSGHDECSEGLELCRKKQGGKDRLASHLCHDLPYHDDNLHRWQQRELLELAALTTLTAGDLAKPGIRGMPRYQMVDTNHQGAQTQHEDKYGEGQHHRSMRSGARGASEAQRRGKAWLAHGTICLERQGMKANGSRTKSIKGPQNSRSRLSG